MLSFIGPRRAAEDALLAASTVLSADNPSDSSPESIATELQALSLSPPLLFPLLLAAFPFACSG